MVECSVFGGEKKPFHFICYIRFELLINIYFGSGPKDFNCMLLVKSRLDVNDYVDRWERNSAASFVVSQELSHFQKGSWS